MYEISMCEPLVRRSRRRRREISEGESPGEVGEVLRICVMWIGRPWRVERRRREVREEEVVNLSGLRSVFIVED